MCYSDTNKKYIKECFEMLYLIETTFILREHSQSPLENTVNNTGKILHRFRCEYTKDNEERIKVLFKKCIQRYETVEVLEKRPYTNIITRELEWDWITAGESLEHVSRYFSVPVTHREEMRIRARRLSAHKGVLTRKLNQARAMRAACKQTLFPKHYKSDPRFKALIKSIQVCRKNYNQKRLNQKILEQHNTALLKQAS
jgi:hypothetical protein